MEVGGDFILLGLTVAVLDKNCFSEETLPFLANQLIGCLSAITE